MMLMITSHGLYSKPNLANSTLPRKQNNTRVDAYRIAPPPPRICQDATSIRIPRLPRSESGGRGGETPYVAYCKVPDDCVAIWVCCWHVLVICGKKCEYNFFLRPSRGAVFDTVAPAPALRCFSQDHDGGSP